MIMNDDDLLAPRQTPSNDTLRTEILHQTQRQLRLVRRWRVVRQIGVGVALFTSGMGVMALNESDVQAVRIVQIQHQETSVPEPPKPEPKRLSPYELEQEAERTFVKAEAAKRYREAGDRYFREQGDYQAALRCYRNFMSEAEPQDMTVSPDDTTLLIALKQARTKDD
jgi:hypothetical protein